MLRKLIWTTAAATLVAAPVAAQAATAAPARNASPVAEAENISQGVLLVLMASGLALLVLIFANNGDDAGNLPYSP